MLDFNDHDPAVPSPNGNAERDELRSALLARLEGVLFALFPAGKVTHGKFVVGDVLGSPGRSLEIELDGERARHRSAEAGDHTAGADQDLAGREAEVISPADATPAGRPG